jgi:hypothetical protein
MSQLDRLTGLKNLRVRGMSAVSFAAYLKAAAINIIRAAAYQNRETEEKPAPTDAFTLLPCAIKEQMQRISAAIKRLDSFRRSDRPFAVLYAA